MNFEAWFPSQHKDIPVNKANAVIKLNADGATVPFMARYRKEQTGNLDEVAIQNVLDAKEEWDSILKRQRFILEEIQKQEKLTPELKKKIETTFHLDQLEDLYLPYKKKKKTKAVVAKEAGLEPLANWIWEWGRKNTQPEQSVSVYAKNFVNAEKKIPTFEKALEGAQHILTERLAEDQELRDFVRKTVFQKGFVKTKKASGAKLNSKFEKYFEFQEKISSLLKKESSHRYLAMRRGWTEKELSLSIGDTSEPGFEEELLSRFEKEACTNESFSGASLLKMAAKLALKVYVLPSIENEVHRELKKLADEAAIHVFAENVRKLLLASPFGSKAVLGIDPGIRTGCKLAVVDDSGKFLGHHVMHLRTDEEKANAKILLKTILEQVNVQAIAIGNGTAGRETEAFVRGAVSDLERKTPVVLVNEAGASIYSASKEAREEFPDLDLTVRGAISIARRLQDPLAELVKIDPKSIGVGQYQHDVNQSQLKKSLDLVVDSCVNSVGVDLNTASYHLLAHVSGIGPALAKAIVDHRSEKGLFETRQDLLKVSRFTDKVFEQSAGFLRIQNGKNPLDNTGVHPERYSILEDFAQSRQKKVEELLGPGVQIIKDAKDDLAKEIGEFTFQDIVDELAKPGRDPREEFHVFQFREDIHEISDVKPGMTCPGIVTNVTNFGAFVDIGVHQDGLVHISEMANHFVKDPRDVLNPGDHVTARVLEANLEKRQIALSLKTQAHTSKSKAEKKFTKEKSKPHFKSKESNKRDFSRPRKDFQKKPRREKQPFNNPFAALAEKFSQK